MSDAARPTSDELGGGVPTGAATEAARWQGERSAIRPFTWAGSPWALAGLCLLNGVLSLLTVGIYSFWGRTEIRRRMCSSVHFLGEPLVYHGTGRELLRGFLAVLVVLLAPLFIIGSLVVIYFGQASATFGFYQIGLFAVVYPILTAVAFYRARRYRLARTSWRGIRGSLAGSSGYYGFMSWALALAYPLTLFWVAPYRALVLQRLLVKDTSLGAETLRFEGVARTLYGRYALLWFGSIVLFLGMAGGIAMALGRRVDVQNLYWWVTLSARDWGKIAGIVIAAIFIWSLMSSFYYAKLYNHIARSTFIGEAGMEAGAAAGRANGAPHFDLDVRGRHIMWLFFTNSLITYLSLYVLRPIATARSMKYYAERLRLVGPFEPALLLQNPNAVDQTGEGLAQAFDLDAF